MGRKKTGSMPVDAPKIQKKMVIDVNRMMRIESRKSIGFSTGRYMTEKDRPRQKRWCFEIEK